MLMFAARGLMWIRAVSILALIPALIAWKAFDVHFAKALTSSFFVTIIVLTPLSFWFRHRLKLESRNRHRSA